jgi:hypothetical protein
VDATCATVAAAEVSGAPDTGAVAASSNTPTTATPRRRRLGDPGQLRNVPPEDLGQLGVRVRLAEEPPDSRPIAGLDGPVQRSCEPGERVRERLVGTQPALADQRPGRKERGHEQHVDPGDRGPEEVVVVGRQEFPELVDERPEAESGDHRGKVPDGPVKVCQQEQERGKHEQPAPQHVGDVDPVRAQPRVPREREKGPDREERDDRRDKEALHEERRVGVPHPASWASVGHSREHTATAVPAPRYRTS